MLKIVDNKRLEMTQDEFKLYEDICTSYKNGKDLFRDLFETDESGIIVFLKPPQKMFSMEVMMFLQNLMVQQHLRRIYAEHELAIKELKQLIQEVRKEKSSE